MALHADILDDALTIHLFLKAAQRTINRFALFKFNFAQITFTSFPRRGSTVWTPRPWVETTHGKSIRTCRQVRGGGMGIPDSRRVASPGFAKFWSAARESGPVSPQLSMNSPGARPAFRDLLGRIPSTPASVATCRACTHARGPDRGWIQTRPAAPSQPRPASPTPRSGESREPASPSPGRR